MCTGGNQVFPAILSLPLWAACGRVLRRGARGADPRGPCKDRESGGEDMCDPCTTVSTH